MDYNNKNQKQEISYFFPYFQVFQLYFHPIPSMKKGFSQFTSLNFNQENSHPDQQANQQQPARNPPNPPTSDKTSQGQKKQPQTSGFSTIRNTVPSTLQQNITHSNHQQYPHQPYPANHHMPNGVPGPMVQSGNFGGYPMTGMQNAQYFNNGLGSFVDNPYAVLFNQFQSNSPSLTSNQASSQAMIMTLFGIIQNQAKSLQSLYSKVQKMTQKISEFGLKMKQMKKYKKQPTDNQDQPKPLIQHIGQSMQNIDSKTLIKILFGSNKVYNYRLQLSEVLELPLYRERNFSISLKLTDIDGKLVKNNNKIPLSLAIYSSENPPKFIEKNTAGQKILKGYIEQSLHHGQCRFEKIQIKEVTSHFRNGWVFIVIIPCMTPLGSANPNDNFIDYLKIQPLVLQKVIVKAKKIKESKKGGKQEKDESEMAEVKDSEFGNGSQRNEEKENVKAEKKVKQQNNEDEQDIFQDK